MGEARLFHNYCCFLGIFGNWYDGRVIAIGVGCKAGLLTGRYVLIYIETRFSIVKHLKRQARGTPGLAPLNHMYTI